MKRVYVVSRRFTTTAEPYFIWDTLIGVAATKDLASHMCAKDLARQNQETVVDARKLLGIGLPQYLVSQFELWQEGEG